MKTVAYVRATNVYDDSRATKEIIGLAKAGYHVRVLAWDRNGDSEQKCSEVFQSVKEYVTFTFYNVSLKNGIGLKNITKLVGFIKWVYQQLKAGPQPDVIHACNLDAGIGAHRYCKEKHVPLVYDIYDYYIDSHAIPEVAVPLVEHMEISVINDATVTIICTEERREQIAKATPKKTVVIHNSPDVEVMAEYTVVYDYAYCGALTSRRLIGEILQKYPSHNELVFAFAGYGSFSDEARALSEQYDTFTYFGTLKYAEVLKTESQAMAIAAIYEPTIRNHRLCAPNKFYEALALAKPVIVCRGTGIDRIVEENDIGIVIDYDAEQFYDALIWLRENPQKVKEMGMRARKLYEEKYRWSLMEDVLLRAYSEVC